MSRLDRFFDRILCWAGAHSPRREGRVGRLIAVGCRRLGCRWRRTEVVG